MSRQLGHYIRRNIDGFQTLKPVVNSYYAGATRLASASAANVSRDRVQSEPLVDDLNTVSDEVEGDSVTNSLLRTDAEVSSTNQALVNQTLVNQTQSARDPNKSAPVAGNRDVTINIDKTQVDSHVPASSQMKQQTKGQAEDTEMNEGANHHVSASSSLSNTPIHTPSYESTNTPQVPARTRQDFTQQVAASILGETDVNQSAREYSSYEQSSYEHSPFEKHAPDSRQDEQGIASNLHLLAAQRLRAEPAAHASPNRDDSQRHAGTDKPALRSVTNRHGADSPQPITVNVTIDQVSILARQTASQTSPQAQRQSPTWKPDLTLADYLRQRQDGDR
ncbi:hypothetical protein [Enterovibrio sp. 27052020O]|uniref:hypothetical protein n=1 Tax=Enterovibrio sp. 27052020O TaxID=3241166 RepID=UPI0038900F9C